MRRHLLTLLLVLSPAAALAQDLGFAPEGEARPGDVLRVGIVKTGAPGLAALDCAVAFDPAVLAFEGTEAGPAAPAAMVESRQAAPGRVLLSLVVPEGASGDGVIGRLRFRVAGGAGTRSPLAFAELSAWDGATLAPLPLRPGTAEVRVAAPGTALVPPPPPAPPAPGAAAPPAGEPAPPAKPPAEGEGGQRLLLILLAFVGVAILFGVFRRRK